MFARFGAAICGGVMLLVCASAAKAKSGIASIYAYVGEKTADGEIARPHGMTAAHRTLPFGTRVRVTNKGNGAVSPCGSTIAPLRSGPHYRSHSGRGEDLGFFRACLS